jgi:ribosomal protein L40E
VETFDAANISNILLIIAGVMLLTTLFVVVLVFFGRFFEWFSIVGERYINSIGFFISCEHCGATLSFKGTNCRSCGKPISKNLLKKYKLRILTVLSFELTFLFLIMGNILVASIIFVSGLVFLAYERHYTKIIIDSNDPKEKA